MKILTNIPRPLYLNRILPYVDKVIVKVLTGQHRVGKSYILKSVEGIIRKSNLEANFICINLEDFTFSHISDAKALNDEIDGSCEVTTVYYNTDPEMRTEYVNEYYKCVWGWGGNVNGYYKYNNNKLGGTPYEREEGTQGNAPEYEVIWLVYGYNKP